MSYEDESKRSSLAQDEPKLPNPRKMGDLEALEPGWDSWICFESRCPSRTEPRVSGTGLPGSQGSSRRSSNLISDDLEGTFSFEMKRRVSSVSVTQSQQSFGVEVDPEALDVKEYVPDIEQFLPVKYDTDDVAGEAGAWDSCFLSQTLRRGSKMHIFWLCIVSAAFLYNALASTMRASFPYMTPDNRYMWFSFDYLCDLIYIIDIIIVKPRIRFMSEGLEVQKVFETQKFYLKSTTFILDILSIVPLDVLYIFPALRYNSLLRLNRTLKYRTWYELQNYFENIVSSAYILRLFETFSNMIYLIHCNGCVYYVISAFQWPKPDNPWIYNGEGNAYIRCFYFATKLMISIGNNPFPTNLAEHIYVLFAWMMGVFVFAVLLGNIRDIFSNSTKVKDNYKKRMDATLHELKQLNVSDNMMEKTRIWFVHTWEQQKTLDESQLIGNLPKKLQIDLAISVHYKTVGKIQLFQGVDIQLIRELVIKLKPVLFLPGDFVCRRGEIAKEMYIVSSGTVQVLGGPRGDTVIVSLRSGAVLGEASLLADTGTSKRASDIKSKGYSFLFVLSKEDLDETLRNYPESQQVFKQKARDLAVNRARTMSTKVRQRLNVSEAPGKRKKPPKFMTRSAEKQEKQE